MLKDGGVERRQGSIGAAHLNLVGRVGASVGDGFGIFGMLVEGGTPSIGNKEKSSVGPGEAATAVFLPARIRSILEKRWI